MKKTLKKIASLIGIGSLFVSHFALGAAYAPGVGGTGTSTLPAKGSLLVGSTSTSYGVLGVGSNGQCPVASSTAPLGISWGTCGSGGGAGSVTTSSALTAGYFPYWANATGGLNGTSTIFQNVASSSVGVGTTQPSSTLHVVNSSGGTSVGVTIANGTSTGSILDLTNAVAGTPATLSFLGVSTQNKIRSNYSLLLEAGGSGGPAGYLDLNYGSGISHWANYSARQKITLNYNAATTNTKNSSYVFTQAIGAGAVGYGNGITLAGNSATVAGRDMVRLSGVWTDATDATRTSAITFDTINNGTTTLAEQMRINGDGTVGIGTSFPSSTLHIINTSSTSKTLIVNNGASTGNIFEAQDNGTAVLTVADGGTVDIGGAATAGFVGLSIKHAEGLVVQTTQAPPYGAIRIIANGSGTYGVISVDSTSNSGVWSLGMDTGLGAPLLTALTWNGLGSVTVGNSSMTGTAKALTVNNGASTGNIFEAQDNGTAVFTVADGGGIKLGGASTISGSNQFIDMSVTNDVSIGSPAGYPYLTVKGGSGLVQVSSWGLGFTAAANSTGAPVTILKGYTTATLQMGADAAAPINQTFKAHDGLGTDIAGAVLTIAGGRGTGAGTPGVLNFQTATASSTGSTRQTLSTRMTIDQNGFVGIGTQQPSSTLHVVGNFQLSSVTSSILYATSTGKVQALTIGTGLSLTNGTLSATGGGGSASTDWIGSGSTLTASSTYNLVQVFGVSSSTELTSPSSTLLSINNAAGELVIDIPSRVLKDNSAINTIDWQNKVLKDSAGNDALTWDATTRQLINDTGIAMLNWSESFVSSTQLRSPSSTIATLTYTNASGTNETLTGYLQVTGALIDAGGNKYSTSTGGGSGSVTTSSAITAGYFPYWANTTGGLNGTSTLFYSSSTGNLSLTSGQMLGADGSQSAPTYSFTNSPATGIYTEANRLDFSANGTRAMLIQTTDVRPLITFTNGNSFYMPINGASASTPDYSFYGDTNTGMYHSAEDFLQLSTGGVNRITINDSGFTGIGTTAPSSTLHVFGVLQLSSSSTIVTASIGGGALLAGQCASATSSIDTLYTSSTLSTSYPTPQKDPGMAVSPYVYLLSPGVLQINVCVPVAGTPNATPYVIKLIK